MAPARSGSAIGPVEHAPSVPALDRPG